MALHTTVIGLTTAPTLIFGAGTTWANSAGATLYDTVTLNVFNDSAIRVRILGSSSTAAVATGFPLLSSASINGQLMRGDEVWGATTASTAQVAVAAWRQIGGSS